jgi:hypothetical protein
MDAMRLMPSSSLECRRCGWIGPAHARYCAQCGLRMSKRDSREPQDYRELMRQGRRLRDRGVAWQKLAIHRLEAARLCCPQSIDPIIEIARTYRLAGQPVRARRWYRYALRRQRDCIEAWIEGAGTLGPYSYFRRARWLASAVASGGADRVSRDQLNRYYARLTGWQRWWIDRILRPVLAASLHEGSLETRTC